MKFRDAKPEEKIGVGTVAIAGNAHTYLLISTTVGGYMNNVTRSDQVQLLDLQKKGLTLHSPVDVEDPEHLSRAEFEALTEQFSFTLSDWEFKKFEY